MTHRSILGVSSMRHDLAEFLPEMSNRNKLATWLRFYCKLTKFWADPLSSWLEERRFGPVPPIEKDRVAHHFGFVEGIPPCTDGPVCVAHGWPISPVVKDVCVICGSADGVHDTEVPDPGDPDEFFVIEPRCRLHDHPRVW